MGRHLPKQKRNSLLEAASHYCHVLGVMITFLPHPHGFTAVRIRVIPEAWFAGHQWFAGLNLSSLHHDMWTQLGFQALLTAMLNFMGFLSTCYFKNTSKQM